MNSLASWLRLSRPGLRRFRLSPQLDGAAGWLRAMIITRMVARRPALSTIWGHFSNAP